LGHGKQKHKLVEENFDHEIVLGTEAKVSLRPHYGRRCKITVATHKVNERDEKVSIISTEVQKGGMTTNGEMASMVENLSPSTFSFVRD
jgi:hypothetical protein